MIIVGAAVAGEEGEGDADGEVVEDAAVAGAEAGGGGEGLGQVGGIGDGDANRHDCDLEEKKQDRMHGGWRRARRDRGEARDHREEALSAEDRRIEIGNGESKGLRGD